MPRIWILTYFLCSVLLLPTRGNLNNSTCLLKDDSWLWRSWPISSTNWQWYHPSCLPPHRKTHSAKVCFVTVCDCERRASGHFWMLLKAQVVLRSNSSPTFLGAASQFSRRNYSPPSVFLSTLSSSPRPLKPTSPMPHTFDSLEASTVLYIVLVLEVLG